ncbi:MAG: TatD family hydrolase [Clostridia bacterium]|nr:TatD family hydrolase [Clostridia bacterium]
MIFDTHAHYDDRRFFGEEMTVSRDELLEGLFSNTVSGILNCATCIENFDDTLELSRRYERIYAALGIHPSDCGKYENLADAMAALEHAVDNNDVAAIGEIGLDYHYDHYDKKTQLEYFDAQLRLAEKKDVPAVIHDRDAHGDVFEFVRKFQGTALIHSCSESPETVRQICRLGHYVSFSGSVTFKNANSVREAAMIVPDDLLLVETDCPYMAPAPFRGKLNHSGYIRYIIDCIAEVRCTTPLHIERLTEENARRLFRLD